jgi:N-acetylglucosamine kinase-like BadF-type ATPase
MQVSSGGDTRRAVAALAPIVMQAAALKDKVARRIVRGAVKEAVKLVAAVARELAFERPYPLALAGGVVCSSQIFRDELLARLNVIKAPPAGVTLVDEPVLGCLEIARAKLSGAASGQPGTAA